MLALNNVTTKADYAETTTREQDGTVFVDFIVTGAAIKWSYKQQEGGWTDDYFLPSTQRGKRLACRGIRVKDAVAGTHAQVTLYLSTKADLP
jgi:hypothetical protein